MSAHTIPQAAASEPISKLTTLLDEAGCLVIHDMLDEAHREAVVAEMAPHMEATRVDTEVDDEEFYPGHTRRVTAMVARSPASHSLVLDPVARSLCDHHLGPHCERYQVHVASALEVGPGAREQVLHREEDTFPFFDLPRPNLILATMWAMSEFRADNGGTLVVPGSHRWPADRRARPEEVARAEMPPGSVLVWLGGTLHGAGANVANDWRYGVIITYSLGWLRQEENQYMELSAEVLAGMSPEMREIAGIDMHGGLGFYDPRPRSLSDAPPVLS